MEKGYELYDNVQKSAGEYLVGKMLGGIVAETGLSEISKVINIAPSITTIVGEITEEVTDHLIVKTIEPLVQAPNYKKNILLQKCK